MSILDWFRPKIQSLNLEPQSVKKAFELQQVGVTGLAQTPQNDIWALDAWSRRNELAYACIEKIKQAAIDPTPIIEKSADGAEWEPVKGHPLARLLARPNPTMDGAQFWGAWLASEHIFGAAYAEIVRNSLGQPIQLWLLNPLNVRPVAGKAKDGAPIKAYEYSISGYRVTLKIEDVLVRRNYDLTNPFYGLSPLQVALGAVDADSAQTDFVRAFFNNGGVPSGLLKFPNTTLTQEKADEARMRFMSRHSRYGRGFNGPAVLDQNAEYQKVGADLSELESDSLRFQQETRICSCFGVPPLLVGAYVGLKHVNQRASAQEAQTDFWNNKMSPLFKSLRIFLTWNLLPEFADLALIENDRIRVGWDMSRVMALQEDIDKRFTRAIKAFQSGAITLNETRNMMGFAPDETNEDYYLRPTMTIAQTPEVALIEAEKVPAQPKLLGAGKGDEMKEKSLYDNILSAMKGLKDIEPNAILVDGKRYKEFLEMKAGEPYSQDELFRYLAEPKLKELGFDLEQESLDRLRKSLIEQARKETSSFVSLVPQPKFYSELSEKQIADVVEEIESKWMRGEFR